MVRDGYIMEATLSCRTCSVFQKTELLLSGLDKFWKAEVRCSVLANYQENEQ